MPVTKSQVERAYRQALATLKRDTDAYNAVLEQFAPPYRHDMPEHEARERAVMAELIRRVQQKITREKRKAAGVLEVDELVRRHWDIKALAADLKAQPWHQTESHRIDRMSWIGSPDVIRDYAMESVTEEEMREAEEADAVGELEQEVIDSYMEALGEAVAKVMRKHVYATFEEGEAFIGQYEDGDIEKLRKRGFLIEA